MRHTEGLSKGKGQGTNRGWETGQAWKRIRERQGESVGGRRETGPRKTQRDMKGRCGHLFEEMAGDMLTRMPTEGLEAWSKDAPGCITVKAPNTGQLSPGNAVYVSACSRPTSHQAERACETLRRKERGCKLRERMGEIHRDAVTALP